MKNFKKLLTIAFITGLTLSLTNCTPPADGVARNTIDTPTKDNYTVEYVSTDDGDYKCLWYTKDYHNGSMSCEEIKK